MNPEASWPSTMHKVLMPDHASARRDLDSETFRRYGHQMVEWIAAYSARDALALPASPLAPEAARQMLRERSLEERSELAVIFSDLEALLIPALSEKQTASAKGGLTPMASRLTILADFLGSALAASAPAGWQAERTQQMLEQ